MSLRLSRRSFLRFGAAAAAGIVVLPQEILIPERKFFLPPRGGWSVRPGSTVFVADWADGDAVPGFTFPTPLSAAWDRITHLYACDLTTGEGIFETLHNYENYEIAS